MKSVADEEVCLPLSFSLLSWWREGVYWAHRTAGARKVIAVAREYGRFAALQFLTDDGNDDADDS